MATHLSSSSNRLQQMLQAAVQSTQWTYSVFWLLCPQQGILVWEDGYYNGAIKTRKTVQPVEVSTDEASLHRSQQLRELYESLSTSGKNEQPTRRPCAALSPEDLTESEWFYLMCISFSFPPGIGLPGKAFVRQQPVWLTHANESDSKIFSRAILAKSARVQTMVCIPLKHGVLELGTTENVEEDTTLIQHAKSFFRYYQPKPDLSEHSTSDSLAQTDPHLFHFETTSALTQPTRMDSHEPNLENDDDDIYGEGGDDDDDDDDEDDDREIGTDTDTEIGSLNLPELVVARPSEPSKLMHIEMSDDIRIGSSDDCSNNLDTELQELVVRSGQSDSYRAWHHLDGDLCSGFQESSGATQILELSQEDAHYSEIVSALLHRTSSGWNEPNTPNNLLHSGGSAFSKWTHDDQVLNMSLKGASQCLLKFILFSVPDRHCKDKNRNSPTSKDAEGGNRFWKGTLHEELSANHVLAERRRREKLNERFIILRSLVPFVTKVDKASILGDTIEYVKKLRQRIQELESRNKVIERDRTSKETEAKNRHRAALRNKRKITVLQRGKTTASKSIIKAMEALSTGVQVSIIEADALLELQCPYRDGLLLQLMQTVDDLNLEITSVQSSSANGIFIAELRAKVKGIDRKKASIVEVKRAIYKVFSQ